MNHFTCGTLIKDCPWHIHAKEEAEVVHRAVEHMRIVHGHMISRENLVANIRARVVRDDAPSTKAATQKQYAC